MPNRLSKEGIQCKMLKSEYWRDSIHKSVNNLIQDLAMNSKKCLMLCYVTSNDIINIQNSITLRGNENGNDSFNYTT